MGATARSRRSGATAARGPDLDTPPRPGRPRRKFGSWARAGIALAAVLVLAGLAGLVPNESLRRSIEQRMNQSLRGYRVEIGQARLQPLGLSLTLQDVVVRQTAHPEPAILGVPRLHTGVHWRELLFLRVVADLAMDRPVAYVNLPQLRSELSDDVPVERKGWQEAVRAIYPLKINLLRIDDGAVTYVDDDTKSDGALELTGIQARASNIRNIHSKDHAYPSPIEASAVLAGTGRVSMQGHADFLAAPYMGVKGDFRAASVPLGAFGSLAEHWNVLVTGGTFSAAGQIEYAPKVRNLAVPEITIERVRLGYLKRSANATPAGIAPDTAEGGRRDASEAVPWNLRLDRFRLVDSTLELVDRSRTPDFRVFLSHANVAVEGLSNVPGSGMAQAKVEAKFMGQGAVIATASFRPGKDAADFDVKIEVGPTPLTELNDLFRAYGKFDVYSGTLQAFSEIGVHDKYMRGYVRPIFKDVEIYDSRQDANKSIFKKVYESVVDVASTMLTNRKKDQVATDVPIEGPIGDTGSNFFVVLGGLIENAFIEAILPGFDRQVGTRKRN